MKKDREEKTHWIDIYGRERYIKAVSTLPDMWRSRKLKMWKRGLRREGEEWKCLGYRRDQIIGRNPRHLWLLAMQIEGYVEIDGKTYVGRKRRDYVNRSDSRLRM